MDHVGARVYPEGEGKRGCGVHADGAVSGRVGGSNSRGTDGDCRPLREAGRASCWSQGVFVCGSAMSSAQGLNTTLENMSCQSRPHSDGDDSGVVAVDEGLGLRVSESVVMPDDCVFDHVEDEDALVSKSLLSGWLRPSRGRMLGRLYCSPLPDRMGR